MRGGEGNDKIWGGYLSNGLNVIEGGNGDDSLYGAYGTFGFGQDILGQGGKDLIRHDIYKGAPLFRTDAADLFIWGDWAYGPEDDPTDATK